MRVAKPAAVARFNKTWPPILAFAVGAIGGGFCFLYAGFLSLLVPSLALVYLLPRKD